MTAEVIITNRMLYNVLKDNRSSFWTKSVIENEHFLLGHIDSLLKMDNNLRPVMDSRIHSFVVNLKSKLILCRHRLDYFEAKHQSWLDRAFNTTRGDIEIKSSSGRPLTK